MKLLRLFVISVPLLLTACGLSDQQKADYASVQESGVSSAIYDKMVHGDALSLYDIKALSRAHVGDGVILRYLRDQHTIYNLNSDDVAGLRKAGVSQSIVDYMLQTPQMYGSGPGPYPYGYGPYWGDPYWGPYWGGPYFYGGYYHHWR
jgi:hypothetical protein